MTLIEQVKRKLNITWNDEETDKRINDIIASAVPITPPEIAPPTNAHPICPLTCFAISVLISLFE